MAAPKRVDERPAVAGGVRGTTSGAWWPQPEQTGTRRPTSMIVREVTLFILSQESKAHAIEDGVDTNFALPST